MSGLAGTRESKGQGRRKRLRLCKGSRRDSCVETVLHFDCGGGQGHLCM